MTTRELKEKYNVSDKAIRKWVREGKLSVQENYRRGMAFQINEDEFLKVKKYYWDDKTHFSYRCGWNRTVFSKIDTPEKAYWLGFILADGCLHLNANEDLSEGHISIDLGGRDVHHLEKFCSFIEAQQDMIQHTTHHITGNDLVHVQICGKTPMEDLYNLGIKPRKSGKEEWIETVFPADFIRGCYDGDGYITKDLHSIGLVGSYKLLSKIQQHFYEKLNVEPRKITEHGIIYRIQYGTESARKKIANYLWYDGCVSLDRKQKLADKIKKIC